MAPLPPNSTQRWFYTYQQGPYIHEMMVRGNSAATITAADTLVEGVLGAIGGHFIESTFIAVEHAAAGSDLRLPVASDRLGDSFGTGTATAYHAATYLDFSGRSEGGRHARLAVFGYKDALGNYRILSSADANLATAIGVLNTADEVGVGIDAQNVLWKAYANLGVNDHWEQKVRA